jgi:hypothetical protein
VDIALLFRTDTIRKVINSQKETTMQVDRVKLNKDELLDEIYAPSIAEKSDKVKQQEADILVLQRNKNLNRFLEASCDCV